MENIRFVIYGGNDNLENKIIVAVKGIILHANKALIVMRDENDEIGAGTWECVGGKIDFGEELENALIREVLEEVGIEVNVEELLYATTFKTSPERQVVILTYKYIAKTNKVTLSAEHHEYRWVSEREFKELLFPAIVSDMEKYNVFPMIF
jgi:8-oxo-dGTP diphosphatase